ncbi:MAG: hypothetical protein E7337_00145 [Clostridiales bacterium]|nr:hypothetical protein [Clostridiales bacterium]
MKRKSFIVGIMLLCILLIGTTAFAATVSYGFTFNDITTTLSTATGAKKSHDHKYYDITIYSSSTVSDANVLGARPRNGANNDYAGSYKTYTSTGTFTKSYYEDDLPIDYVYFRMKKDNSSTSGTPLSVSGSFVP